MTSFRGIHEQINSLANLFISPVWKKNDYLNVCMPANIIIYLMILHHFCIFEWAKSSDLVSTVRKTFLASLACKLDVFIWVNSTSHSQLIRKEMQWKQLAEHIYRSLSDSLCFVNRKKCRQRNTHAYTCISSTHTHSALATSEEQQCEIECECFIVCCTAGCLFRASVLC